MDVCVVTKEDGPEEPEVVGVFATDSLAEKFYKGVGVNTPYRYYFEMHELSTDLSADGVITQRLFYDKVQELSRWVCDTREESIVQSLVSLGWTPPVQADKIF